MNDALALPPIFKIALAVLPRHIALRQDLVRVVGHIFVSSLKNPRIVPQVLKQVVNLSCYTTKSNLGFEEKSSSDLDCVLVSQ